ncbi:MAG TPA: carboxymuconolactone decarboxylase family protein [Candidatus Methylomirabilis sp.]|nr:carboxymuconolactone decarboxylase family protein [Candidatus Methylomirabilis sp.]
MLPGDLEQQFSDFYHAAYADGEVDGKTKILIGMAVSMAVGCYP